MQRHYRLQMKAAKLPTLPKNTTIVGDEFNFSTHRRRLTFILECIELDPNCEFEAYDLTYNGNLATEPDRYERSDSPYRQKHTMRVIGWNRGWGYPR